MSEVFWGVALQPGKPTWFGTRDEKLVFGLPGNPVSAVVTFSLFAWPALMAMQGASRPRSIDRRAVLGTAVPRNRRREQAIRVRLEPQPGADPVATPNGPQGSHIMSSLLGADALALIPPGDGVLEAGTVVDAGAAPALSAAKLGRMPRRAPVRACPDRRPRGVRRHPPAPPQPAAGVAR